MTRGACLSPPASCASTWPVSANVDAHRRAGAGSLSHLFIGCAGSQVLHGLSLVVACKILFPR